MEVEKEEIKQEHENDTENRENEAPNEVGDEKKFNPNDNGEVVKPLVEKTKSNNEEINCKNEFGQNHETDNLEKLKDGKKNEDSLMADAKTNVTSEEIKQETQVIKMDIDVKTEEFKTEKSEIHDEEMKPVVKTTEDKIVETIPNGDKFNHINNLHNGKESNGTVIFQGSNRISRGTK